jgi:caffeoyl-CoA O-methyltransferase
VTALHAPRPVTPLGILAARLQALTERLEGCDPAVADEVRALAELAGGFDPYVERCTSPASPALRRLAERTQAEDWSRSAWPLEQEMLSGHVEGQTLAFLVHLARARRVLDIGMFTGYSALAMAEALPEDGVVVACEVDAHVAAIAREAFAAAPGGERIDVRVAPAQDTLGALAADGEPFDLVFLDADKAGYLGYVQRVLDDGLLRAGGVICVDNTLMQGQPWLAGEPTENGAAIAAFNDAVAGDPRVEQVLLPVRDGLTLIRRV